MFLVLTMAACPQLTGFAAARTDADPSPFEAKAMVLTPDSLALNPMPEKFRGEPLPGPRETAFLVGQALQLIHSPPVLTDGAVRKAAVAELFRAVADGHRARVLSLLAGGTDVNSVLPSPAEPDFAARFRGGHLHYFVTVEEGLTPLMLAAATGDTKMVRLLLENGASPSARTKRHRTFALWLAGKAGHVDVMQQLLGVQADSEAARVQIEVDLGAQTATLIHDGGTVRAAPVSTGRQGFRTPAGEYVVTDKHRKWRSTLYPADMPYFMRLSCGEIGFHEGNLPGYPASHGCIRLRREDAAEFFKRVPIGARVVIK